MPSLLSSQLSFLTLTRNGIDYNNLVVNPPTRRRNAVVLSITCCSDSDSSSHFNSESSSTVTTVGPPMIKKRKRYRKPHPGEKNGITEEMRFVAMRLRNVNGKFAHKSVSSSDDEKEEESGGSESDDDAGSGGDGKTWMPSMKGFVKYLVDSRLVFSTIERIVDNSEDVSYAYFRRTGLERAERICQDLEWLHQQEDIVIPEPSNPGITYTKYLEELAENSAPLYLSHFYNIYFSHIAGGQVIARQVSEKLIEGRDLEFYKWDGDVQEMLKNVREKLNTLGEHWTRDERNKCLKEATKSFRYMGQIVRLIIL